MTDETISVVLVDDSVVIRGLLSRILEEDPQIDIVATRSNGQAAIEAAEKYKPQIMVLDIEMPVMDGITALPEILKASPQTKVLICSTLSDKNADISIRALSLGASECILKPSASRDIAGQQSFRQNLVNLVRGLSGHRQRDFDKELPPQRLGQKAQNPVLIKKDPQRTKPPEVVSSANGEPILRRLANPLRHNYEALAIGSSTGGPQALFEVLKKCKNIDVPIFITQHMPPTFTKILAKHIEQNAGIPAVEAEDGMSAKKGQAHVAPGGYHMVIEGSAAAPTIKVIDEPPENYCKPSVEPMMRSLIDLYKDRLLTVILTGMGHDGADSCTKLVDIGTPLIAQDKTTSVVWGMPGAVANAGLCTDILPLDQIGGKINEYLGVRVSA